MLDNFVSGVLSRRSYITCPIGSGRSFESRSSPPPSLGMEVVHSDIYCAVAVVSDIHVVL